MTEGSPITALLGPTNTGKTHRAVERMLAYDSGMIGLPLRLLAREVYDRITARVGEARVALVTGEEKRVPRRPDYWVCTVEAMPMDREVDFLAVDEIQLAAHDQRGHVFTERLLAARGRRETWFMGADTMRPIFAELCPAAKIVEHPRLSRLTSAGSAKLTKLPPRSAVVAFGMPQVYAIAERLRVLRGGAAVVLGALSPRTRNAQVALFQAGEVDYLVATDAIGMGLNLGVTHVAFAGMRKFDGHAVRDLDPAELAQIAGRAGRYTTDGTFGTVAPQGLPPELAQAIELHRFAAIRRVFYRNTDLDLGSIDALTASLRQRPRSSALRLVEHAEDTAALVALAQDPAVRARARGPEAVGLLWEVCRIPDFRKLLLDTHVTLLAEIYAQLSGPRAILAADFLAARLAEIDDPEGDIDTLLARIASIRTWTYISHRTLWVPDASAWQERARAIEDHLSDALHDRLVQRFVDRGPGKRSIASPKRARGSEAALAAEADAAPVSASHPFAALASLRARDAPPQPDPEGAPDRWVESLVSAAHERFALDEKGRLLDTEGERVLGHLTRGTALLLPEVRLIDLDELGAGARSRILRRLVAFARDLVNELYAPLRVDAARELSPAARGVVYQLEQGLGTLDARAVKGQTAGLSARDRELFAQLDVVIGGRVVYAPSLLKRAAVAQRAALSATYFEGQARPALPRPGAVSTAALPGVAPRDYLLIGYPVFGARAIRADVVERVHRALVARADAEAAGAAGEKGPSVSQLASLLGCSAREVPTILAELMAG
jgi:ATP-dependent RNA helicase SUPV3L1/SUV3